MNGIKAQLFILFFSVFPTFSYGQNTYAQFHDTKDIVEKAEIARFLWNEYLRNDMDSLRIVTVELLESAQEAKNGFAKAIGNSSLGSYLIRTGDVEGGIWHLKEAEKYFDKKGDHLLLSETLNEIGHGYYLSGNYNEAIHAYLASIKAGEKAKSDPTAAFNGKLGLGRAYYALGDTAVGIHTIQDYKGLSIEHLKYEAAADAYAFLGMIEMDRGNNELSREYYEKSIQHSERGHSKAHLSHAYNNKAILHFNIGELDSSLMLFEQGLRIREKINHVKGIVESYYNLGFYYNELKDLHNAYIYFSKSAEVARGNDFRGDELDALKELLIICGDLGYKNELAKIEARITELEELITEKESADQEVIAYAENILKQIEVVQEVKPEEESSTIYIWLIGGAVLIAGLAMFRKTD